jgi:hypothetical protein
MKSYLALFGTSALVSAALIGYAAYAHGPKILGTDYVSAEQRPASVELIAGACVKGSREKGSDVADATLQSFCGCYADELLNIATESDFVSIENGMTYRFQIKVDRAAGKCRTKLNLASR